MTGEAMQTTAWLTGAGLGFTIAFGLVIGSFLNVVIHRLPLGQSIVKPGSHCPSCNAPGNWFCSDILFSLFSFLLFESNMHDQNSYINH